jgi:hypothetical protein
MTMHHHLLEASGTKTTSTKVIGRYEMLITIFYQILELSSLKNPLSMHFLWNGTILMTTDISETEQLLKPLWNTIYSVASWMGQWTMELNHGPLSVINSCFRSWLLVPVSPPSPILFNPLPHGGRTYWPITFLHANFSKSAEGEVSSKIRYSSSWILGLFWNHNGIYLEPNKPVINFHVNHFKISGHRWPSPWYYSLLINRYKIENSLTA